MTRETISADRLNHLEAMFLEADTLPSTLQAINPAPGLERQLELVRTLGGQVPGLIQEIRRMRAESARAELRAEQLKMSLEAVTETRDRYGAMLDEALVALAGAGIMTPEKGFRGQHVASVARHIEELEEQRDQARRELVRMTKEAQARAPEMASAAPSTPVPLYPVEDHESPEPRV